MWVALHTASMVLVYGQTAANVVVHCTHPDATENKTQGWRPRAESGDGSRKGNALLL